VAEKIDAIEKKSKSLHRDHRKEGPGEHPRDWMHHLMQAQGSQNVNLCQRLSFENKSLEHTTSQCLLENGFPQIIVPSQHQPWKH
jgi:hypothetical protein